MRIYSFTAGAANMYCGSCIRDNALAAELMRQGHDVMLLPLYTPTLVDEPNVSHQHISFGGISVYLQQHSALFRQTPWLIDKLWDSRFALKAASKRSIPVNPKLLGEMTVAMLEGEQGPNRKEFEKLVHWLGTQPEPDVLNLPNSMLIGMAAPLRRLFQKPVFCTLQGEDLFLNELEEPFRSRSIDLIRRQVSTVDGFVAVSRHCALLMQEMLHIPEEKLHVVPLGINLEGRDVRLPRPNGPLRIGYFARVAPEKSLHLLCEAYRWLRQDAGHPPCRLEAAGYLAPEHKPYLAGIERQMQEWGLGAEFHYHGSLDREHKNQFLGSLDVFGVPSLYAETKGLYVLEAMASGLPVVAPRHGSFPEMVETTGGGLLVEPHDARALGQGILSLLQDAPLRQHLARRALSGVAEHYSAARMAERTVAVYGGRSKQALIPAGAL